MKKVLTKLGFKRKSIFSNVYTLKTQFGIVECTVLCGWVAIYSEFRQMYEGYNDLQMLDLHNFENYFKIIVK